MTKDKRIIEKQKEIIEHLMGFVYESWNGSDPYKFLSKCKCSLCVKFASDLQALESEAEPAKELENIIRDAYQRGYEDRDFDIGYGSNIPYLLESYLKPLK